MIAGPEHRLRFDDGPHPYLEVRAGLDALVARPVYYELAELALAEGAEPPGLWSGGAFFALEPGHEPRRRGCARRSSSATRRSPILIAGDVLDEEEPATASPRPRCWSRSSTGPSRP